MRRRHRRATGIAAIGTSVALVAAVLVGIPLAALATGGLDRPATSCSPPADEAAPAIAGSSGLTIEDLRRWWADAPSGAGSQLSVPAEDLLQRYLDEADAEGIRGDLAIAQATLETGYFTSTGTTSNNYAGIAHYDGRSAGATFPDAATGVRAHIQLLKKFASGNGVPLAHPDVAPTAGARATTWPDLAGTWASDPDYWASISRIHGTMQAGAEAGPVAPADSPASCSDAAGPDPVTATSGDPPLRTVAGITVHESIADQLAAILDHARGDGIELSGWGYRSHDRQIELRRQHCGTTHYAIYEMPSSECSPPTARPGASMHEQGLAIDFEDCSTQATSCHQWLTAHAGTYGLYNLPSEPWHWSTNGR